MSVASCNNIASFVEATRNWSCLRVGSTYMSEITFLDSAGDALPITADTFTMTVYSSGTLIDTLTVGDGLELNGTNKLQITFAAPVTATVGKKTYRLNWEIAATGEDSPAMSGYIDVVALNANCTPSRSCSTSSSTIIRMGGDTTLTVYRGVGATSPTAQEVEDGGTVTIAPGKTLLGFGIESDAGARTLNIGTTDGGTQIAEAEEIPAGEDWFITATRYFPSGATLYFSGADVTVRIYTL